MNESMMCYFDLFPIDVCVPWLANYLYSISHFLLYFLDKCTFLLRISPENHNLCHLRIHVKVLKK